MSLLAGSIETHKNSNFSNKYMMSHMELCNLVHVRELLRASQKSSCTRFRSYAWEFESLNVMPVDLCHFTRPSLIVLLFNTGVAAKTRS